MRKAIAVTLLMVILSSASVALAGEKKPAFYVGGGLSMPMSPQLLSDNWKTGFSGTGRVGFALSPALELGASVGFNSFPMDNAKLVAMFEEELGEPIPSGVTVDGFGFKTLEFLADIKYVFGATAEAKPFSPYMLVAFGMTKSSFGDITVSGGGLSVSVPVPGSTTDLTMGFGAGFQYMFSPKVGFWVDGKYMMIMTEGESTAHLPIRAGLKFMVGGN